MLILPISVKTSGQFLLLFWAYYKKKDYLCKVMLHREKKYHDKKGNWVKNNQIPHTSLILAKSNETPPKKDIYDQTRNFVFLISRRTAQVK